MSIPALTSSSHPASSSWAVHLGGPNPRQVLVPILLPPSGSSLPSGGPLGTCDGRVAIAHPPEGPRPRPGRTVGQRCPGGAPSPTRTLCFCPQSADASRQPATLAGQFKQSLDQLMRILSGCQPSFIRCIKPNEHKRPMVTREAGRGAATPSDAQGSVPPPRLSPTPLYRQTPVRGQPLALGPGSLGRPVPV